MSRILHLTRAVSGRILGPYATLHAYDADTRERLAAATGLPEYREVTEAILFAQAPMIYGGTDEIQHNIIGERVLGLPKEPGPERSTPFRDLPRNG
jgi:alkylation response protein AidB-like acyl-CoA dehydrogenase